MHFFLKIKRDPEDIPPLSVLLASTGIATFMAPLDGSIVNISLVTIARYYSVDMEEVRWISLTYLLVITSLISFVGKLGDRYGNKQVFQLGFLTFSLGSFLASFAPNLTMLVVARVIQALGAAGTMSNGIAIVTQFTTPKNRGRAIGINSLIVASALSIGPFLGGFLTEFFGWQSIFLINVPIGVIGIIMVELNIPSIQTQKSKNLDIIGTILFASALSFFVLGLTMSQNVSTRFFGLILIFLSVILVAVLIPFEQRIKNPIIDFSLFKDRRISLGVIAAVLAYASLNSISFLLPFYYQDIREMTQTETGLMIVAMPICMSFIGPMAGYLSEKYDARILSSIGILGLVVACFSLITLSPNSNLFFLILITGLAGCAMAFFTSPNSNSIMSATPKPKLGLVGGFIGLARNIGFILGITLGSSIFYALLGEEEIPDLITSEFARSYSDALGLTFIFFVTIALLGLLLSTLRGPDRKQESRQ
ncbi:MAG: MFS transporter [Promethearchaeota archaeon]